MSGTAKVVLFVVVGCVLICGGLLTALIIGGGKLFDWAKDKIEQEVARNGQWQTLTANWLPPPADADPSKLFPPSISGYNLTVQDDQAAIASLNIALAGSHGVYKGNDQTIEIYAWRANDLEREGNYKRVLDIVKQGSGVHTIWQNDNRLRYSSTRLGEHGAFWGDGQWLFLARSTTNDDPEMFLLDYVEAINAKSARSEHAKSSAPEKRAEK